MWKTIKRPGYFGKKRDDIFSLWNKEYGEGNWRLAWQWGDLVIERKEALQIYEDAYYEFLRSDPGILSWLVNTASDVYDTAPTNVQARFSYEMQETPNNHIHDVAIRRAVLRLGKWFQGSSLIQVRSTSEESWKLSPCMVSFHHPELILPEENFLLGKLEDYPGKGSWWREKGIEKSVEEFYQHNKLLQILAQCQKSS